MNTEKALNLLEAMKKRPSMYLGGEDQAVWVFENFMYGFEIGAEVHLGYGRALAKSLNCGPCNATNKDISIRDAIQFAIDLVKEKGVPSCEDRIMKKALE